MVSRSAKVSVTDFAALRRFGWTLPLSPRCKHCYALFNSSTVDRRLALTCGSSLPHRSQPTRSQSTSSHGLLPRGFGLVGEARRCLLDTCSFQGRPATIRLPRDQLGEDAGSSRSLRHPPLPPVILHAFHGAHAGSSPNAGCSSACVPGCGRFLRLKYLGAQTSGVRAGGLIPRMRLAESAAVCASASSNAVTIRPFAN